VAFVGTLRPRNIPQRIVFLEQFRALHPLFMKEGAYQPVFARASIVLNQTAAGEVNFRCFESMACGAALLTEESLHGLTDLFTPGVHILPPYRRGDAAGAAAIARDWLARPDDLLRVAQAGRDLVRARHTDKERAAYLADLLEQAVAASAHVQRLRDLGRRRKLLSTAYAILCAELTEPSLREHRALYQRMFESLS
jgi:spore maturation protein CgeB